MHDPQVYPLTFTPVLRDYIWGGRRLETLYGRDLPPGIVAESWEISGHPTAPTVADAGYWTGQSLPAILAELGERLVGTRAGWALQRQKFPLLVKLLDAAQDLSLQVHPDDAYALGHEAGELGKTEMWYVLHAEPGAELILGLQPGTTRDDFATALQHATRNTQHATRNTQHATRNTQHADDELLMGLLRRIPVRAGQAIAIPTGTVHALLAGTVVTEIQQNSDTTYRVYDWGRVGADGKPRALHVEKALKVLDFAPPHPPILGGEKAPGSLGAGERIELVRNRYFVVEEVALAPGAAFTGATDGSTMEIWGCVAGQAQVEWDGEPVTLPSIRYALLPAALGAFRITAGQPSRCLRVYLPEA
ncbi:MAG: class I mannose-6-phosphate isomerase [Chloroflexi bacterium]|nr:class I mannose-6-phosphate isomerase [Chloroflexota bacterium]